MTWYNFWPVEINDGMWDHPTPAIRRDTLTRCGAFDDVWLLDGQHPGPTDEEVMRPIVEAAMREDTEDER